MHQFDLATQPVLRQLAEGGLLCPVDGPPVLPATFNELAAWIHVTNACNLRCTYCYIAKTNETMTTATGEAAIDAVLRSAHLHGYKTVLLKYAGGEASLNFSLVEHLHQYAQKQAKDRGVEHLRGVLLSNGVGLTTSMLQTLRDLNMRLMLSLDGSEAFHDAQRPRIGGQGSYHAAIASINRARALGVDITVSITVTGASVAGLPSVVSWLLDQGVHFTINFYREHRRSAPSAELKLDEQRLIEGLRAAYAVIAQSPPAYSLLGSLLDRVNMAAAHQRTCPVGESYLVIDQHGAVAKCQMEIEHPITTIQENDPLAVIRADRAGIQNVPVEQKEECRQCVWKYWCSGGCAVTTVQTTGRYDTASPNCAIYKALYPDVLRLEGLRLLYHAE
jgi:uncharacterized protein